ncbi:MAG: hypothetical protein JXX14_14405 [Deltaproteobacteria bacterium]|nr:hypothetical protein [Deltaproteobacteria bacterium]
MIKTIGTLNFILLTIVFFVVSGMLLLAVRNGPDGYRNDKASRSMVVTVSSAITTVNGKSTSAK